MIKNMTRKGLAIGATGALALAGLVGVQPAYANDLSLSPVGGTTYNVLLSDTFTLGTAPAGNTTLANMSTLKFEVVKPAGVTIAYQTSFWDAAATPAAYSTPATVTPTGTATTQIVTPAAVTDTDGRVTKLVMNPSTDADSTTFSVTVRAFADRDGSGTVSDGDLVSVARTITFHKGTEVSASLVLDQLVAGTPAKATLTLDKGINLHQTAAANHQVLFGVDGAAGVAHTGTPVFNADETALVFTQAANVTAGQIITAQAQNKAYDGASFANSGASVSSSAPAASTATTARTVIANSEDIRTGGTLASGGSVNVNKEIAAGVRSLNYDVAFRTATAAVGAGVPVAIAITTTNLATGEEVTVNGRKLTTNTTSTVNTVTQAGGIVPISVSLKNGTAGTQVLIVATSNTGSSRVGLEMVARALSTSSLQQVNLPAGFAEYVIGKGESVSMRYELRDQFGKLWSRTGYSYRVVFTQNGTATMPVPLELNGAVASITYTDNSTAASGNYNVVATLQDRATAGDWANVLVGGNAVASTSPIRVLAVKPVAANFNLELATLDDDTTTAVSGASAADAALADETVSALDNRFNSAIPGLGITADKGIKLSGKVRSASNAGVVGGSVTISAPGVAFSTGVGGTGLVTIGSITVTANATGDFAVFAYTNTAGSKTFTFTSGAASATQVVNFALPSADADVDSWSVSAPANVLPGSTLSVVASLVDEYGNPVTGLTVSVTKTGPGLLVANLPTATGTTGIMNLGVLLGANDSGSVVFTFTFGTGASAITETVTITVGAAPAAAERGKVNVGSFNGKLVVYALGLDGARISWKVAGRWGVANAQGDTLNRFDRPVGAAGRDVIVEIYVDRVLRMTKVVRTR